MFGELEMVFEEVKSFLAPIKVTFSQEKNAATGVAFNAQFVHIPKLDMKHL